MKKRINTNQIQNKITVDERDSINLFLCEFLSSELGIKKDKIFELKDLQNYINQYNNNNFNKSNPSINLFLDEIISKIKTNYKIMDDIYKNTNIIKVPFIEEKSEINSCLFNYKQNTYSVFKEILNSLYDNLMYNESSKLDINDYLYAYLFHPNIYDKLK